jgi:hypothetical protein
MVVTLELTKEELQLLAQALDTVTYTGDIKSCNQVFGYVQAILDLQNKLYRTLNPQDAVLQEVVEEVVEEVAE